VKTMSSMSGHVENTAYDAERIITLGFNHALEYCAEHGIDVHAINAALPSFARHVRGLYEAPSKKPASPAGGPPSLRVVRPCERQLKLPLE